VNCGTGRRRGPLPGFVGYRQAGTTGSRVERSPECRVPGGTSKSSRIGSEQRKCSGNPKIFEVIRLVQ
jgi:hypothetical protein